MTENNISSLVVTKGNNTAAGIVTKRDLVTRVCVHDASSKNTTLEEHNVFSFRYYRCIVIYGGEAKI